MSNNIPPTAQQAGTATHQQDSIQRGSHQNDSTQHSSHLHDNIHENRDKAVLGFYEQMMALAHENTIESAAKADEIAHELLTRAELPLLMRAHAHIVLSAGKRDYLFHAQEALRIAEKGREAFGPGDTAEEKAAVDGLIWEAQEMIRRAESDLKELAEIRAKKKAVSLKVKKGEKIPYMGKGYANQPGVGAANNEAVPKTDDDADQDVDKEPVAEVTQGKGKDKGKAD